MSKGKKLLTVILTVVMVMGFAITAHAAGVKVDSNSNCPHSYCANHKCGLYLETDGFGNRYYWCEHGHLLGSVIW